MSTPIEITQGATRILVAKKLRDAQGALFDPTGWSIRAALRQQSASGALVATWDDDPSGSEGLAEVVNADPDLDPTVLPGEQWIYLHITPAMSTAWTWSLGVIQCEITAPTGNPPEVERIIDTAVALNIQAVLD